MKMYNNRNMRAPRWFALWWACPRNVNLTSVCIRLLMNTYKRYRYHSQIISYAIWLYHRFTLSFRDIDDILAERGIIVS